MNRYLGLIIILLLGVFALLLIYLMTSVSKTESFDAHEHTHVNKNNKGTSASAVVASHNPHRLPMSPIDETCNNKFDKKGFVSVQEFMDGERYRCYE